MIDVDSYRYVQSYPNALKPQRAESITML